MNSTFLAKLRLSLDQGWIIAVFGIVYLISQTAIIIILGPIEHGMLRLQITGFTVSDYLAVFGAWQASGDMMFYRAHFLLDDYHWIWYSVLCTALLAHLFERLHVSPRFNWFLVLPLMSGILDWFENHLQHVFLSSQDFSTIVDPLPLLSTVASDIKWILAAAYIGTILVLAARVAFGGRREETR